MKKISINKNKLILTALSSLMTLTTVVSPNIAYASTPDVTSSVAYDETGEKLFLEKSINDGVHTAIVKNEDGVEVASFVLDTNSGNAYLNGELLPAEQLQGFASAIESLGAEDDLTLPKTPVNGGGLKGNLSTTNSAASVTYYYSGTNEGSLWVVKAGAAAAAAAISVLIPGAGWAAALAAGSAIVGATGTVYYRMHLYYGYSGDYIHVKRVTTFYKDSAKTSWLYGPITSYQTKSTLY